MNSQSRGDNVRGAHVMADRLIYEAKELAAGRVPEQTPRQKQVAEEKAKAAKNAEFPVFSIKDPNVSGPQFGAQIGNISDDNMRVLLVDPDGSYFWGDRKDGQNLKERKPATWGEHAAYERAMFKTAKEAKAAGKATPQTKRAPSGPAAPAQAATPTAKPAEPEIPAGAIVIEPKSYDEAVKAASELEVGDRVQLAGTGDWLTVTKVMPAKRDGVRNKKTILELKFDEDVEGDGKNELVQTAEKFAYSIAPGSHTKAGTYERVEHAGGKIVKAAKPAPAASAPAPAKPAAKKPKAKKAQPPPQLDLPPPPTDSAAPDQARGEGRLDKEKPLGAKIEREQAKAKKLYADYMKTSADLRAEDKMYRLAKWDKIIADARDELAKAKTRADYYSALYDLTRQLLHAVENARELEARRADRAKGVVHPVELPPPPETKGKPAPKITAQVAKDTEAVKELYAEYERLRPQFEEERPGGAELFEDQIGELLMLLGFDTATYREYAADLARLREVLERGVKAATPKAPRPLDRGRKFKPGQAFADVEATEGQAWEHPTTAEGFKEAVDHNERLFEAPDVKVHATDDPTYTKFISDEEAAARIAEWKAHAQEQGENAADEDAGGNDNENKVIISLFDFSGQWSKPYVDAGYTVYKLDLKTDDDIRDFMDSPFEWLQSKMSFMGTEIHGMLIAVPCTDFSGSGSTHFAEKDADGRTEASKDLVIASLQMVELLGPTFWVMENPVGRIRRETGLPIPRYQFHPYDFGDTYMKKTQLYGVFNTNLPTAPVEPVEGSKMWSDYGGKSEETKAARSETPEGFAYAFFMANNAIDAPKVAKPKGKRKQTNRPAFTVEAEKKHQKRLEAEREARKAKRKPTQGVDKQVLDRAATIERAAEEAEAEGLTDEAESLRRYADELRGEAAPAEATAGTTFKGTVDVTHGSVRNISQIQPAKDVPEDQRYDTDGGVLGNAFYSAERGDDRWFVGSGSRLPDYNRAIDMRVTFDNALVLMPENASEWMETVGDGNIREAIEGAGDDGVIVRGFDVSEETKGRQLRASAWMTALSADRSGGPRYSWIRWSRSTRRNRSRLSARTRAFSRCSMNDAALSAGSAPSCGVQASVALVGQGALPNLATQSAANGRKPR